MRPVKSLARSEDAPLLGLDARVAVTFPRDGLLLCRRSRFALFDADRQLLPAQGRLLSPIRRKSFRLGGRRGEVRGGFARGPEDHRRFAEGRQESPPGFRESA